MCWGADLTFCFQSILAEKVKATSSTNNNNNNNNNSGSASEPRKGADLGPSDREDDAGYSPNLLFQEIPEGAMNAIFDLFIWDDGPRIRDLGRDDNTLHHSHTC